MYMFLHHVISVALREMSVKKKNLWRNNNNDIESNSAAGSTFNGNEHALAGYNFHVTYRMHEWNA